MKRKELEDLGFSIKKQDDEFWFELKTESHTFITNDSAYNKGNDVWHIGYDANFSTDTFWFNNQLFNPEDFKTVYRILTGKPLTL